MFEVGDKVVCVEDGWPQDPDCSYPTGLRVGAVYVVEEFWRAGGPFWTPQGRGQLNRWTVNVVGVVHPEQWRFPRRRIGWGPWRFRKLIKTPNAEHVAEALAELKALTVNTPALVDSP